jgi:CRISPR-associated protein Cas2
MRNTYIVAYDIVKDKSRTKAHKILKGFGEALQYSVFRCDLSDVERVKLQTALWDVLNLKDDRIVIVDLGPRDGRATLAIEAWGKPLEEPAAESKAIIV